MKRHARTTVTPQFAGEPLIDFLVARFTYHDRERWLKLIEQDRLLVNDVRPRPEARLQNGDTVEYLIPDIEEPPANKAYQIVGESDDLLVINKPPNLPCHPGGRYFRHTLWHLLKEDFPDESLHLINRLDRETSGLVVLAKSADSAKKLGGQFAERQVKKEYDVLVEGDFPAEMHCSGRLVKAAGSPVRKKRHFVSGNEGEGETAETLFCLKKTHGGISWVRAIPTTGRLHQIRATLFSMGYPVVGDKIYGVDDGIFLRFIDDATTEQDARALRLDHQALHAAKLTFTAPSTGEPLVFTAPMPADMRALARRL